VRSCSTASTRCGSCGPTRPRRRGGCSSAPWDAIGAAGRPPQDQSFNVALYAIALLILASIVILVAVAFVVRAI